jgi:hypothetical protein
MTFEEFLGIILVGFPVMIFLTIIILWGINELTKWKS